MRKSYDFHDESVTSDVRRFIRPGVVGAPCKLVSFRGIGFQPVSEVGLAYEDHCHSLAIPEVYEILSSAAMQIGACQGHESG